MGEDLAVARVRGVAAEHDRAAVGAPEALVEQRQLHLPVARAAEVGPEVARPQPAVAHLLLQRRDQRLADRVAHVPGVLDDLVDRHDLLADEVVDPVELLLVVVVGLEVPAHVVSSVHPSVGNGDETETPPSTVITVPVVKLDASDARYSAVPTISGGWPRRCSGIAALGERLEAVDVPRLRDVGEERPDHDPVRPHRRPERHGEALGQRVQPGLRRGVRQVRHRRVHGADAADVDDRAAGAGLHPLADQRAEAERPLEVDADDLVEQILADRRSAAGTAAPSRRC